jgi:tight adherence protein C
MDLLEYIAAEAAALGFSFDWLADFALALPVLMFVVTGIFFVISAQNRRTRVAQDKMADMLLKGARRRSGGLSYEEIIARLRPEAAPDTGGRKVLMKVSEILLKLVNFNREETVEKLIQSGDRDPRAISRYMMQRGLGMLIGPIVGWMVAPMAGLEGFVQIGVAGVGVLAGGILVDVRLDKAVSARRAKLQTELPVMLDLLTIYLEAGQAFDVSMARAAQALKVSFPTAAAEMAYLRRDLEMSVDRERTLREFADRVNTQVAKTFIAIVVQSEKRGNAIAPALRTLAREARKEVMAEVEKKAQKIPTMMQMPMFLLILPAIFASVIGPAAVQIMIQFGGN